MKKVVALEEFVSEKERAFETALALALGRFYTSYLKETFHLDFRVCIRSCIDLGRSVGKLEVLDIFLSIGPYSRLPRLFSLNGGLEIARTAISMEDERARFELMSSGLILAAGDTIKLVKAFVVASEASLKFCKP